MQHQRASWKYQSKTNLEVEKKSVEKSQFKKETSVKKKNNREKNFAFENKIHIRNAMKVPKKE